MARSQPKQILRSAGYAVVMAVGLSIVSVTGAVGSPEDEIARLNRVRGNLFEELVKTRAEAAIARSELDAARKARDAAEAEVKRLRGGSQRQTRKSCAERRDECPAAAKCDDHSITRGSSRERAPCGTSSNRLSTENSEVGCTATYRADQSGFAPVSCAGRTRARAA